MDNMDKGFVMVLSKKEAAAYLGITERTLTRYVKQGKLSCKYIPGKTRTVAMFDESELEDVRAELEAIVCRPSVSNDPDNLDTVESEFEIVMSEHQFELLVEGLTRQQRYIMPHEKLLLTLSDAQELTGLSRATLRGGIRDNKLNARIVGYTWRIKPSDLEQYVKELF